MATREQHVALLRRRARCLLSIWNSSSVLTVDDRLRPRDVVSSSLLPLGSALSQQAGNREEGLLHPLAVLVRFGGNLVCGFEVSFSLKPGFEVFDRSTPTRVSVRSCSVRGPRTPAPQFIEKTEGRARMRDPAW